MKTRIAAALFIFLLIDSGYNFDGGSVRRITIVRQAVHGHASVALGEGK